MKINELKRIFTEKIERVVVSVSVLTDTCSTTLMSLTHVGDIYGILFFSIFIY